MTWDSGLWSLDSTNGLLLDPRKWVGEKLEDIPVQVSVFIEIICSQLNTWELNNNHSPNVRVHTKDLLDFHLKMT